MQRLGYKITLIIMALVGLLELAISKIHIEAILIMFARQVGFYLFLFILFGILLIAILTSIKALDSSDMFKLVLSSGAACGSGIYTAYLMWKDCIEQESILFHNIQYSFILLLFGIAVYLIGTLVILGISISEHKEEKN